MVALSLLEALNVASVGPCVTEMHVGREDENNVSFSTEKNRKIVLNLRFGGRNPILGGKTPDKD